MGSTGPASDAVSQRFGESESRYRCKDPADPVRVADKVGDQWSALIPTHSVEYKMIFTTEFRQYTDQ